MKLRYAVAWVGCTVAALAVTYVAGAVSGGSAPVEVPGVTSDLPANGVETEAALPLPTATALAG
ncbi:hypothetical protein [Streptomyces sp. NPDC002644]